MGVPENIDALLVKFDINQDGLARIADVAPSTVSRWRKGAMPRMSAIKRICDEFNLTEDDILSDVAGLAAKEHNRAMGICEKAIAPAEPRQAYLPLLGRVHAGDAQEPQVLDERISLPYEIWEQHPDSYFLEVEGQCMSKVYPEGSYILIDPKKQPSNGSIAVVSIDGADYVMRRLYRGASVLVLSPDSWEDHYEDIVISDQEDHTVEYVGVVVWYQAAHEME